MKKRLIIVLFIFTASYFLTGCESYIRFEIARTKVILFFFVITFVIGIVALLLKKDK